MCQGVIQVGRWPLCAGWLVALLPLVGVALGAVLTQGTLIITGNRRRSWELQEKKRE